MKEVPELVFLQPSDVFRHDAICRQVTYFERLGVEVLPVVDGDAADVEELEVGAKGAARVRDRLIA